jgi:hypothetical protein
MKPLQKLFRIRKRQTQSAEHQANASNSINTDEARQNNKENKQIVDTSFPDATFTLHDCEDVTIDIYLLYGLTGNRINTRTAPGQFSHGPEK